MLGATDLGTRSVPVLLSTDSHYLRANWSNIRKADSSNLSWIMQLDNEKMCVLGVTHLIESMALDPVTDPPATPLT
jgi:hypothetical protein